MFMVPYHRRSSGSLSTLRGGINELFDRFFEDFPTADAGNWAPALDVSERDDQIVVKAELPGIKPEEIDIEVQGSTLYLSGEKQAAEEEKCDNHYYVERRWGSFKRAIPLTEEVDSDKIEASCSDGVLTVTLPKTEAAKPRKIKVNS